MRHLSAVKSLSRHSGHREAMIRNMVMNLVEHGRIRTTIQKAKAARPLAEKLITLGKKGTPHERRLAISTLGSTVAAKRAVIIIFGELKDRFASRPGGYTRILRLPTTIRQAKADLPRGQKLNRSKFYGTRLGDNSTLVLWELCEEEVVKREKVQKQRRGRKSKDKAKEETPADVAQAPVAETKPAEAAAEAQPAPAALAAPESAPESKPAEGQAPAAERK